MKKKLEYLFLVLILIFGFFLRIYKLGVPSFWIDESISSIVSMNILQKALPILDSGLFYSRAYVFHYLQAFFLLFAKTDFLARLPSVIFGLLTIILAYKIGKEYSKTGGIISALFFSVFYLEVFYSRQARFYQLFQLMFFLSIYFLYKSKNNPKYLYASLISFFITINTQIAGLVLAPFFIFYIFVENKDWKKYLAILPGIPLIWKFISLFSLTSKSGESAINYASQYFVYTANIIYLFILFIFGSAWAFIKNKKLTFLIITPSIILLIGIFALRTFALRYAYFFVFPLVLYSSLLLSFLYEKYGKIMLILIVFMLIFPSNLIFPHTAVNLIKPIDYNYNDFSSPEINLKNIPQDLINNIKNSQLICLFSPSIEWYLDIKPNYVFAFSMDKLGNDSISYGETNKVDVYSGAQIIYKKPENLENYYVIADYYSVSKLKPSQFENFNETIANCSISYENNDLRVYGC